MMPRNPGPPRDARLPEVALWLNGTLVHSTRAVDPCAQLVDLVRLNTSSGRDQWRDPVEVGTVTLTVSVDGPAQLYSWRRGATVAAAVWPAGTDDVAAARWLGVWHVAEVTSAPRTVGDRWTITVTGTDLLGAVAHALVTDDVWLSESQWSRAARLCSDAGMPVPELGSPEWPRPSTGRDLGSIETDLTGTGILDQLRAVTVVGTVVPSYGPVPTLSGPLGADHGWSAVRLAVIPDALRTVSSTATLDACHIVAGLTWSLDDSSAVTSVALTYGGSYVDSGASRPVEVAAATDLDPAASGSNSWRVDSWLASRDDAATEALRLLATAGRSRWRISTVTVDLRALDAPAAATLLDAARLPSGAVALTGLVEVAPPELRPDGSPRWADGVTLLVERVAHSLDRDSHTVTLSLSAAEETLDGWRYGIEGRDPSAVPAAATYSGPGVWRYAESTFGALAELPAIPDGG